MVLNERLVYSKFLTVYYQCPIKSNQKQKSTIHRDFSMATCARKPKVFVNTLRFQDHKIIITTPHSHCSAIFDENHSENFPFTPPYHTNSSPQKYFWTCHKPKKVHTQSINPFSCPHLVNLMCCWCFILMWLCIHISNGMIYLLTETLQYPFCCCWAFCRISFFISSAYCLSIINGDVCFSSWRFAYSFIIV